MGNDMWYEEYGITKPFYGDDWVAIIKGDCREELPKITKPVDLVLTDPPYTSGDIGKRHENSNGHIPDASWFGEAIRLTGNLIFTPGITHIWDYPPAKWVLCWYKPSSPSFSKLGGYNIWEPILFYGRYRKVIHDVLEQVPLNFITEEWAKHPCPKPPPLWEKLVSYISDPGEIILDPFLGSGTTAYCAKKLNRKCIGIELEEKYCEIAAKRCSQSVMRLDI